MTTPPIKPVSMISQRQADRDLAGDADGYDLAYSTWFPGQPHITPHMLTEAERATHDRKFLYRVEHPFVYEFRDNLGMLTRLIVPRGFLSDGASVPRPFWPFIAPDGLHRAAALIHDFLYRYDGLLPQESLLCTVGYEWVPYLRTFSKREADDLFKVIMKRSGVGFTKRQAAYWAVRTFARRW